MKIANLLGNAVSSIVVGLWKSKEIQPPQIHREDLSRVAQEKLNAAAERTKGLLVRGAKFIGAHWQGTLIVIITIAFLYVGGQIFSGAWAWVEANKLAQNAKATQTFQIAEAHATQMAMPTTTPTPTSTPPPPVWVAADRYVAGLPEILVPPAGLTCKKGVTFTIEGTSLIVEFNGQRESIASNDPLFANGTKWSVIEPLDRWGVTYLDPSANLGQSNQISQTGWIVDNNSCRFDP